MIKVSDLVADFFVKRGIADVFTIVGGGAMHLNDSFGHNPNIRCIYNHHEQACSIAAEAYYRVNNRMAGVCVTSGPGAINALNGVVGAYQDSIPMLVVSGQVKTSLTIKSSGLDLRTYGGQEFDIVACLNNSVKYAETVYDKNRILYCLEKAYHIAKSGRPGPCWLDIPIDIQGSMVDEGNLEHYSAEHEVYDDIESIIGIVAEKISKCKRPVLYAGNGIRWAGALDDMSRFVAATGMPVVTCWDSIDVIESDDVNYVGRAGIMGNRAGNFAVQNSDFLLCIGNRLSIYQVGYNKQSWAREAYVVDVDIDANELKKPTIHVELPIHADAKTFLEALNRLSFDTKDSWTEWREKCSYWKNKYPVVTEAHCAKSEPANVYAFVDKLSRKLPENCITVVANGSASVVGSAAYHIGRNNRFIMNCALSSMGYDLPAAIGACLADGGKSLVCIAGDGSIQMNIQELQTIITNKLPIKIFVINNEGYHQIRLTQKNIFDDGYVGVGKASGDLGFPDFEKLAWAYGFPYHSIRNNDELDKVIGNVLAEEKYCICEVFVTTDQLFEPKSSTKKLADGSLYSPPLEDMAPFLPRGELKENMIIRMIEE